MSNGKDYNQIRASEGMCGFVLTKTQRLNIITLIFSLKVLKIICFFKLKILFNTTVILVGITEGNNYILSLWLYTGN